MENRDKIYAKVLLAVAIGFSFAAEVTDYAFNEDRHFAENKTGHKVVQERASASEYQEQLSFWE